MADLDDLQAAYGVPGLPESRGWNATSGTSNVTIAPAPTSSRAASQRWLLELVDIVADTASAVSIMSGSTVLWGPVTVAPGAQYTASDIVGEPGASIVVTRSIATVIGGGVNRRLLG